MAVPYAHTSTCMKRFLTLAVLLLLSSSSAFSQDEIKYKEYSYAEFFQMIEDEEDTIFRLENAYIIPDPQTDKSYFNNVYDNMWTNDKTLSIPVKDTLVIDKIINLDNVQFIPFLWDVDLGGIAYLSFIHFKKYVQLTNVMSIRFGSCTFDQQLNMGFNTNGDEIYEQLQNDYFYATQFHITHSNLKGGIYQASNLQTDKKTPIAFFLRESKIALPLSEYQELVSNTHLNYTVEGNEFTGEGTLRLFADATEYFELKNNHFESPSPVFRIGAIPNISVIISDNTFDHFVGLSINSLPYNANLNWSQFANKSLSLNGLHEGIESLLLADSVARSDIKISNMFTLENVERYANPFISLDEASYKQEQLLKGFLISFYKSQNDLQFANAVYVESKDLETARLAHLYKSNKTFESFFTWKINQFLKVFSAYGTKPAKAIVFSAYVILAFALVYLFFPNHWDSHGKNRIKNRFLFFHKYLRLNKGIQDVYLDSQQEEIESSHAFRKILDDHKDEVPAFFYNAAGPLLKWSTAGSTIYAKLLRRVDFLKGSWKDTDPKVRGLKTALTIVIFIIALVYDMLIKMLNALMLSINTFTTLGFGEIPIKGLPRYLAIIQGFIGWFMLTIFSVSLISQLLA